MKKKALIFGIKGQDGAYLAKLLINKDYRVFGVSRSSSQSSKNFKKLDIDTNKIKVFKIKKPTQENIFSLIKKTNIQKIFFFTGISSVQYSIDNPIETLNLNIKYFFYVINACKKINKKIKIFNSISSDCFGSQKKISELSNLNPQSPYALSKSIGYYLSKYYKDTFNLWISNGILFNHESSLRPNNFIFKNIINQFNKIKKTKKNIILLGNPDISRDWGWAPEFVDYIYKISELKNPDDFVIATGKTYNLRKLIRLFSDKLKIKKKIHIIQDINFKRKNDIKYNSANIEKLKKKFKSNPQIDSLNVIWKMYNKQLF